jgi:xanthine dehydrogenase accessory factor
MLLHWMSLRVPPLWSAPPSVVMRFASDRLEAGCAVAMATVVARHGSAPSTPGQKLACSSDGGVCGTVGGGAVEREVVAALHARLTSPGLTAELRGLSLGAELAMCCGGRVQVFLETLTMKYPVLIVGAGHVATALAPLLAGLDFQVVVTDSRDAYSGEARSDIEVRRGEADEVAADISRAGACLVMTHDHALDQTVIEWALRQQFAFVGGVGSRAKAERTRQRLVHKSIDGGSRLRMPLGVDCGARSPQEIAVAIAAELIALRAAPIT